MGYYSTTSATQKGVGKILTCTEKSASGDFFEQAPESRPGNRRQPLQLRQENRPKSTPPASGRPYWPSRDPIGIRGGVNEFGMVSNGPVAKYDYLGKVEKCACFCGADLPEPPDLEADEDTENVTIWTTSSGGCKPLNDGNPGSCSKQVCEIKHLFKCTREGDAYGWRFVRAEETDCHFVA